MKHETLSMEKHANPFRLSIDHGVGNFDLFHVAHVATIFDVASNGEIVEIVSAVVFCGESP
jgi:hypothetical protein